MKKVLRILLLIIAGALLYSFGVSTFENARVNSLVKEFVDQGVLVKEEYNSNNKLVRRYYEVESDYVLDSDTYIIHNDKFYLGNIGDVVVSQEFPFPNIPLVNGFVTYYFGGHAAMISGTNEVLQIAGFPEEGESIFQYIFHNSESDEPHRLEGALIDQDENYFLKSDFRKTTDKQYRSFGTYYRKKLITLRVLAPESDRFDAVEAFRKLEEDRVLYNYLFFLDTKNKYYCTDIISRTYKSVEDSEGNKPYKLNDDGFITSVNDLILSKDTIISNYFEVDKNGVENIYYRVNK